MKNTNKLRKLLEIDTLQSPKAKEPEKTGEMPKKFELCWMEIDKDGEYVKKEKSFDSEEKFNEFIEELEQKPNFLQITRKQNKSTMHKLKENYNRFFLGKAFENTEDSGKKINESDEAGMYTLNDGWNIDELDNTGLLDWIMSVEALAYELRNARRNSYAKFGDTDEDLIDYLMGLAQELTDIASTMEEDL